jgi:hypothetical protein
LQYKPVSSPSLHVETPELSLNEELPGKLSNLDVENSKKSHCVIMRAIMATICSLMGTPI